MLRVHLQAVPPRGGIPRQRSNARRPRTPQDAQEQCYRIICPDPGKERLREALAEQLGAKAAHLAGLLDEAREAGCDVADDWLAWAVEFVKRNGGDGTD